MAQVYLPMGYPILSGNEFANVIYQGNVVRLYQIPVDPRSDAQLQNRRFLSDVVKIRANLGLWAKGGCRAGLGSKWGTIIYQVIKADIENWWSDALEEWDGFGEENQNEWRSACPYQATFNDVGQMYFGLTRVIYHALLFYCGETFGAQEWAEDESAEALAWWIKDQTGELQQGKYDDLALNAVFHGSWTDTQLAGCYQGRYTISGQEGGEYLTFTYYGKSFMLGCFANPSGGIYRLYLDGVQIARRSQYYASPVYQAQDQIGVSRKAVHLVKFERESGIVNIDFIEFL